MGYCARFVVLGSVAIAQCFAQAGGAYVHLDSEQKRLVERWVREYGKISGKKFDSAKVYNQLSPSTRTTFDAVTNALAKTKLSDKNGKPLGTALDLVELVESAAGHLPGVRGDHQFRVYVLLKPDALSKLYSSREFQRIPDNTVFHIGYPLNFRQDGGAPSIQFSITRTGQRADIDVDYRTSHGAKALFNGHLTSANSDVRAGNNFFTHSRRWDGLADWWKSLFGHREEKLTADQIATLEEIASRNKTPAKIDETVNGFLKTWLVDGKVREANGYFSPASYSCLAELGDGSSVESPLARARILNFLTKTKAAGGSTKLNALVTPGHLAIPEGKPAPNAYSSLFALEYLRDDIAFDLDCRQRFHTDIAYRMQRPPARFTEFYASSHEMKGLHPDPSEMDALILLWGKEEGNWRILSWHLEHPLTPPKAIQVSQRQAPEKMAPVKTDPALANAVEAFLYSWLVRRDDRAAIQWFTPESMACAPAAGASGSDAKAVDQWLKEIGHESGKGKTLEEHIAAVSVGHRDIQPIAQSASASYLLARISDQLAAAHGCKSGALEPADSSPRFTTGTYLSAFRFRTAAGSAGILNFLWTQRDGGWKISSFYIIVS